MSILSILHKTITVVSGWLLLVKSKRASEPSHFFAGVWVGGPGREDCCVVFVALSQKITGVRGWLRQVELKTAFQPSHFFLVWRGDQVVHIIW